MQTQTQTGRHTTCDTRDATAWSPFIFKISVRTFESLWYVGGSTGRSHYPPHLPCLSLSGLASFSFSVFPKTTTINPSNREKRQEGNSPKARQTEWCLPRNQAFGARAAASVDFLWFSSCFCVCFKKAISSLCFFSASCMRTRMSTWNEIGDYETV